MGAPKAVQSVTLVGGGCAAAFDPQLTAMDNLKEKVLCLLSRSHDIPEEPSSKLILRRRVFHKVSTSTRCLHARVKKLMMIVTGGQRR